MNDPRKLVEEATRGDAAAVDELVERYLSDLHAYVRRNLGPAVRAKEDTLDVAQSVCREILGKLAEHEYNDEEHFRNWLFVEAHRKIVGKYRRYTAQRRDLGREVRAAPATEDDSRPAFDPPATPNTPSSDAQARETHARFLAAFEKLDEPYREVFRLSKIEGLSNTEIAQLQGKPLGTVSSILSRALARLAQEMDERRS